MNLRKIGGSDIAAIVGLPTYRTAYDVWLRIKHGYPHEQAHDERMYWGTQVEGIIMDRYERDHGVKLVRHPPSGETDIFRWSPDAVAEDCSFLVEVKTVAIDQRHLWDDGVPDHYRAQAQWYMHWVRSLNQAPDRACIHSLLLQPGYCDFAILVGGNDYREYRVERDDEVGEWLEGQATLWWQRFIEGDEEPDPLDSTFAAGWLQQRWKGGTDVRQADEAEARLLHEYGQYRAIREKYEKREEAAKLALQQRIADDGGLYGPAGRVTWKRAADSERTDWAAVAAELGADEEIIRRHTRTQPGPRKFIWRPAKEA